MFGNKGVVFFSLFLHLQDACLKEEVERRVKAEHALQLLTSTVQRLQGEGMCWYMMLSFLVLLLELDVI